MKTIDVLSSIDGRKALRDLFFELKYKKQYNNMYVLFVLLRICTIEKDVQKYSNLGFEIEHSLGIFRGTGLWMEEVVNRYFFTTINSFVYLGAAILLVLIGLRRFSTQLTDEIVIAGVIFEAAMLLVMFIVMLFSPEEELGTDSDNNQTQILVEEIGEIATDFAASSAKLDDISFKYEEMILLQKELIQNNNVLINNVSQTIKPSNEMLEAMNRTAIEINKLKDSFENLNNQLEQIKKEEIERAVRKELERIFTEKVVNDK